MSREVRFHLAILALAAVLIAASCASPTPYDNAETAETSPQAAIATVLAQDTALGSTRNHASETGTLADAVRDYIAALDSLDFAGCPTDFTAAFRRHRDAWHDAIPFFERFDDERGELHVLFDRIRSSGDDARAELEAHEKAIMATWAEVEAAAGD